MVPFDGKLDLTFNLLPGYDPVNLSSNLSITIAESVSPATMFTNLAAHLKRTSTRARQELQKLQASSPTVGVAPLKVWEPNF